ncbi:MAG TPA: M56 family metallopeptidase [Anaerovoracaceae bacterium]|nr:M56 family metallopeptidase [Anaerovoracaceae bacterium]
MLSELFYWVLNMSIVGSAMGFIILGLRKIQALPRFFVYLLWVIPLLRFWVPVSLSEKYSLMTFISHFTTKTVVVYEPGGVLSPLVATNLVMAADSYFPVEYKTGMLESVFSAASLIWAAVACTALIALLLLYAFAKARVNRPPHLKENVYLSDKITVPAVYGIRKPRIILPEGMAEEDLKYVLLHENAHLSRRDNLFRCIALITACIHWFNPFVWLFLKYCFEDMELACDAKVLKSLSEDEKKRYALSLLSFTAGNGLLHASFGGAKIRVRIENILSYKKLTLLSAIAFALLVSAIGLVLLTNAQIS